MSGFPIVAQQSALDVQAQAAVGERPFRLFVPADQDAGVLLQVFRMLRAAVPVEVVGGGAEQPVIGRQFATDCGWL
nr:hypothetical protein [Azotobacter salinestris]